MSDRPPPLAKLEQARAEFNAQYPVGTAVTYTPILGQSKTIQTTTRSEAWVLGAHTVVVIVTGITGCVATRNISPEIL